MKNRTIVFAGALGFIVFLSAFSPILVSPVAHLLVWFNPAQEPELTDDPEGFRQIRRPRGVDLDKEYNLTGLLIPRGEIHTLLPRDSIPALTDPKRQRPEEARWLSDDARVIVVSGGDETLAVPLRVLDWHEVVNTTLAGEPIAVTYCPLCDSAAVFSRRVRAPARGRQPAGEIILEFGVSGALYNSNVLIYDRRYLALWSQLGMRAVSGPLAGTELEMLPFRLDTFEGFRKSHPNAEIVSNDTGHARDYSRSHYEDFLKGDGLMVPVRGIGAVLPKKTLGLGVLADGGAWFIPESAVGDGLVLETPRGPLRIERSDAGMIVRDQPPGVRTVQTFYYSWSAFHPRTVVVAAP